LLLGETSEELLKHRERQSHRKLHCTNRSNGAEGHMTITRELDSFEVTRQNAQDPPGKWQGSVGCCSCATPRAGSTLPVSHGMWCCVLLPSSTCTAASSSLKKRIVGGKNIKKSQ